MCLYVATSLASVSSLGDAASSTPFTHTSGFLVLILLLCAALTAVCIVLITRRARATRAARQMQRQGKEGAGAGRAEGEGEAAADAGVGALDVVAVKSADVAIEMMPVRDAEKRDADTADVAGVAAARPVAETDVDVGVDVHVNSTVPGVVQLDMVDMHSTVESDSSSDDESDDDTPDTSHARPHVSPFKVASQLEPVG